MFVAVPALCREQENGIKKIELKKRINQPNRNSVLSRVVQSDNGPTCQEVERDSKTSVGLVPFHAPDGGNKTSSEL